MEATIFHRIFLCLLCRPTHATTDHMVYNTIQFNTIQSTMIRFIEPRGEATTTRAATTFTIIIVFQLRQFIH